MHVLIVILAIVTAWRRADWGRFREFHATILYMSSMNLFYYYLTVDYRLWVLMSTEGIPVEVIAVLYTFVLFPCTVMLFLTNYPGSVSEQIWYNVKWVIIYLAFEATGYFLGGIHYYHGWTLGWSLLFLVVMFPMLRLHYKYPFLAYGSSIIIIAGLIYWFQVPWIR